MLSPPNIHIDTRQNSQQRESPANPIDNRVFRPREELVYDVPEKQNMDQRPDEERPWCRRQVRLLASSIDVPGSRHSIYVRSKEEDVRQNVHNL